VAASVPTNWVERAKHLTGTKISEGVRNREKSRQRGHRGQGGAPLGRTAWKRREGDGRENNTAKGS